MEIMEEKDDCYICKAEDGRLFVKMKEPEKEEEPKVVVKKEKPKEVVKKKTIKKNKALRR